MKRVIFLLDAQESLDEITYYTETNWPDSEQTTDSLPEYVTSLIQACNDIPRRVQLFSDMTKETRLGEVSYFRCGHHFIFYRETDEAFEVIQILHERMNFSAYLE